MLHIEAMTHFLEMFVLLIASKPIHSTFARSHALHAGNFPSHFCFLLLHRVQELMALATLYCVSSFAVAFAGCDEDVLLFLFGALCDSDDIESFVDELRLFVGREEEDGGGGGARGPDVAGGDG